MANYRVGPSSGFLGLGGVFLPSDLKADADTLQGQVDLLEAAFQAHGAVTPGSDLVDAWVYFQGDWAAFYADHFQTWIDQQATAWNDGNRDQLVQFEQRFATLRDRMNTLGVDTQSEDVEPKPPGSSALGELTPIIVILVLAIVGIVVLNRVLLK